MATSGIIILILNIVCILPLIIFRNRLKVVLNKYYIIVTIFALFCFLYFIIARYSLDVQDYIKYKDTNNIKLRSMYLSKTLLLDMCPLMAFLLPLFSFFKKTKRVGFILCPISIIGSCITIFGQIIWEDVDMNLFAKYLFIGIGTNRLYFMMHFLTLILAIIMMIVNYKYSAKDAIYSLLFYVIWFAYVSVLTVSLDIICNASGMVEYDWANEYGQYHKVYLIWPLPFPYITLFWYSIVLIVNYLLMLINNVCTKKLNEDEVTQVYNQVNMNYWTIIKEQYNKVINYLKE